MPTIMDEDYVEYIPSGVSGERVLCAQCGTVIAPNAANLCIACIRNDVDITAGIPKQSTLHWCKGCERYLQPPAGQWVVAALESKELLALCLKKLKRGTKFQNLKVFFFFFFSCQSSGRSLTCHPFPFPTPSSAWLMS